jgi:hypothetical protein
LLRKFKHYENSDRTIRIKKFFLMILLIVAEMVILIIFVKIAIRKMMRIYVCGIQLGKEVHK